MQGNDTAKKWASRFPDKVVDAGDYFPLREGLEWKYAGREIRRLEEGDTHTDTAEEFENIVRVSGKKEVGGSSVFVFADSNFNNRGKPEGKPWIHYFRREDTGVFNHGSVPPLLEQVGVPCRWVPFPIDAPGSYIMVDKKRVNTGVDLNRDGKNETEDVKITVLIVGLETISVPAGTYPETARLELRADIRKHFTATDRFENQPTLFATMWYGKGIGLIKRESRFHLYPGREGMLLQIQELAGVRY